MKLDGLPTALRDHGVKVSVEWQAGRPGVPADRFIAKMNHHTVGPRSGMTPSLAVIKRGRPGLPGPLANLYSGRDLICRCITKGGANHPGAGGSYVVGRHRIPKDNGRAYFVGHEIEHTGTAAEPWTDEMHEHVLRCDAAVVEYLGVDHRYVLEHKEWATERPNGQGPSRKIDRYGIDGDAWRARLARFMEDDDMATPQQNAAAIHNQKLFRENVVAAKAWLDTWKATARIEAKLAKLGAPDVDEKKLAINLAPLLVDEITGPLIAALRAGGAAISEEQLEAALREVLGSLND